MSIRETVKMTLQTVGYKVFTAEDGARGLQVCQQEKADLVITDLNMPNVDGITLIMLTTESNDEKKNAGKRAGATGWIVKPFDPARFLAVVQKVCPQ